MSREFFPKGITLSRNDLGGLAVEWNGIFIGWIHASIGDQWNAYVRGKKNGDPGIMLGRFTKDEAVRRIALAAGWPGTE
ncbi:hypothetical protein [Paractinoplanes rishiriensis]|uniref:Uncharacterized protein n=1 Tax=Paractinoplanes rishiriensis TaxID=1050105 RepID=A0A919JZQ0_9ACTN|nr:hypothetical protein [Actinoplanes rishiriensis]GIE96689.1 hypothetical protein Ari01nite_41540 [Actinoplanes rishiriensis]